MAVSLLCWQFGAAPSRCHNSHVAWGHQIRRGLPQLSAHLSARCRRPLRCVMNDEQTNLITTRWGPIVVGCGESPHKTTDASDCGCGSPVAGTGMTAVDAARRAGYAGDGEQIRRAGCRARSPRAFRSCWRMPLSSGYRRRRCHQRSRGSEDFERGLAHGQTIAPASRPSKDFRSSTATSGPTVPRRLPTTTPPSDGGKIFLKFAFDEVRAGIRV